MIFTIKELLCLTEEQCLLYIADTLEDLGIPYIEDRSYIVTDIHTNKVCPLICVHTDTVGKVPPLLSDIMEKKGVLSLKKKSISRCLGADDRAGIWIALEMLRRGTRTDFEYGFFTGEETGGIGSSNFSVDMKELNYSCFIGLDRSSRSGIQNVAGYGYDNDDLVKYFNDLDFLSSNGTFTDCSLLAGACDLACVNLSVGYEFEHSSNEILTLALMEDTLQVMCEVEMAEKIYKAKKVKFRYKWKDWRNWEKYSVGVPVNCDLCGRHERLVTYAGMQVCEDCAESYAECNEEIAYGELI